MVFGKGEMHEEIPWFARGNRDHRTLLVAEIGNNHEGSLGNAIKMIEESALHGADAVKIQHHIAIHESTSKEDWPKRFSYHPQDKARFDYWGRIQFDEDALKEIDNVAKCYKVELIASPFSVAALNQLECCCDCAAYKIASGEVNNVKLLDAIYETGKPIILSTGMSDTREVNTAIGHLLKQPNERELYILQCTTEYPVSFEKIGMNVVDVYSRNILFKGGLSDHSGTIYPGIVAAYLGAYMVEVHVCFSKRMFGADISSSLTFEELRLLHNGIRASEIMRSNPINKDLYVPIEDTEVYRKGKKRC